MAITVDSVGSADGDGTTVTLSHTITAVGSDLMLTVGSAAEVNVNQDVTITGVTWNGTSLIAIGNADFDNTSSATFRDTATLWYLINPDTGTHDVVATCATDPKGMTVGAISLIGAKQQAPEASATNKDALVVSGRASVTLSSISDNAWFVDQ